MRADRCDRPRRVQSTLWARPKPTLPASASGRRAALGAWYARWVGPGASFLREWWRNPGAVGAICPSSNRLAERMVQWVQPVPTGWVCRARGRYRDRHRSLATVRSASRPADRHRAVVELRASSAKPLSGRRRDRRGSAGEHNRLGVAAARAAGGCGAADHAGLRASLGCQWAPDPVHLRAVLAERIGQTLPCRPVCP